MTSISHIAPLSEEAQKGEVCGKGGGFILRATTDSIEHHKPENIKAMVDSAKKYGWY